MISRVSSHLPWRRMPAFPVTAYSSATAAGPARGAVLHASRAGRTALAASPIALPFETQAGAVPQVRYAPVTSGVEPRIGRLALAALEPIADAVRRAVSAWGPDRVAIVVGTSTGGIAETESAYRELFARGRLPEGYHPEVHHAFDALVELLSRATGAMGPRYVVSTACASSAKVFGAAQRLLTAGVVDAVLAGGVDSLCETTLRGFAGLRILSSSPCRPFGAGRDGISIGEGGAFLLVEREVDVTTAHLLGVGETSDAHHMTAPHPEGLGAIEAMRAALALASLEPGCVRYIHAHGTGTPQNDRVESDAIVSTLGADVPVSSTKGITGHLLGAAGAISAVVCLDAMATRQLPVNVGARDADPAIVVDLVTHARSFQPDVVLSNAFAFGGCNASVLFGTAFQNGIVRPERDIHVVGTSFWASRYPTVERLLSGNPVDALPPAAALLGTRARGRASVLTRMMAEVVGQLAGEGRADLRNMPVVYASAFGEMATTIALLDGIVGGESVLSPLRFQASVHNTAAGLLSIQTGSRAFSTALAAGRRTAAMALIEATAWLRTHGGELIVAMGDEEAPGPLWQGWTYPAVAMGLHLVATEGSVPDGSLGRLGPLRVGALAERSPRTVRFDGNPSAGALTLLECIAERRIGEVPLEARRGEGWTVELLPGRTEA